MTNRYATYRSSTNGGRMTSTLIVECPRCGHAYQPTRAAIIAGVWRTACPVCKAPGGNEGNLHGD